MHKVINVLKSLDLNLSHNMTKKNQLFSAMTESQCLTKQEIDVE